MIERAKFDAAPGTVNFCQDVCHEGEGHCEEGVTFRTCNFGTRCERLRTSTPSRDDEVSAGPLVYTSVPAVRVRAGAKFTGAKYGLVDGSSACIPRPKHHLLGDCRRAYSKRLPVQSLLSKTRIGCFVNVPQEILQNYRESYKIQQTSEKTTEKSY